MELKLKGITVIYVMAINMSLLMFCAGRGLRTAMAGGAWSNNARVNAAEPARKLQNPVANLISVREQNNWDIGSGLAESMRFSANVQPVIPFSVADRWNLITRANMHTIHAESALANTESTRGFGDIVQCFFFVAKESVGNLIMGARPVWRHRLLSPCYA